MADVFKKNVVTRRWEATYRIGRAVEIQYIRSESEYTARQEAELRQEALGGILIDFHAIGEKPKASDEAVWKDHDEYIAEVERLKKQDKTRPMFEIVEEILARDQTTENKSEE